MLRKIIRVIYDSNKQSLNLLFSKSHFLNSSNTALNSYILSSTPFSSLSRQRNNFPKTYSGNCSKCRHCGPNSFLGQQFYDKILDLNNPSRIDFYVSLRTWLHTTKYNRPINELQKRFKSKKSQKRPEYDSDSDEEEGDDEEISKATKPVTLRLQSLRLDGLLKKTLGIARNKAETAFYAGDIRVNGTIPSKKSYQVKVGDEVDLIKGVSPLNPDFLAISRVEVLSVKEDPDEEEAQLIVKLRRTKTLYVENYESAPWKKSSSAG